MIVKLLTEHHLEFINLKEAAEAHLSLHMSKCHIVGNLMQWLVNFISRIWGRNMKLEGPADRFNRIYIMYRTAN